MAFCQSTQAPQQRQPTLSSLSIPKSAQTPGQAPEQLEGSQEWVLFSPSLAESAVETNTTFSDSTPRTVGLSRFSDFGSFNTATRLRGRHHSTAETLEVDDGNECEELDSLDSHLHAFREPSIYRFVSRQHEPNLGAMLPAHDGLGTFGPSSVPGQDQSWRFEQLKQQQAFNEHQKGSSILEMLGDVDGGAVERERIERIERWRIEQSQILLDEIQKESRRRRRMSRVSGRNIGNLDAAVEQIDETDFGRADNRTLAIEEDTKTPLDISFEQTESFWKKITRTVIRDIIGIDEPLLSIICGQSLPIDEATTSCTPPEVHQVTDRPKLDNHPTSINSHDTWEDRIFYHIARELGTLVHQLSDHSGAFNTLSTQQSAVYAGFSLSSTEVDPSKPPPTVPSSANGPPIAPINFIPTIQQRDASAHAALWGIEEEHYGFSDLEEANAERLEAELLKREREYWEKALDVKTVFSFLRNRFTSGSPSRTARDMTTPRAQDTAARAALIRHHHPLISRSSEQRSHLLRRRGSLLHHRHCCSSSVGSVKRSGSSCASQSAKKSAKRSGSSRNYWDLNGSVGSGSAIAASGGIGFWGEV